MADLRKIGLEGFALIDKFYGPTRRSSSWIVSQVPNNEREEHAVTSRDAAAHLGGISVVSYSKGKPHNRWGKPIKY